MLQVARSQRGVICTTPEAVKSLMLMNVDILSSLENYEREVVSTMLVQLDQGKYNVPNLAPLLSV